jgi:hypothetical protein
MLLALADRRRAVADTLAATDPSKGAGQSGAVNVTVVTPPVLSRAQTAFRALQAQYPNQLGGRRPIIRRADLGAGTYYRTLVGPLRRRTRRRGFAAD